MVTLSKKKTKARQQARCDFCRKPIVTSESFITTVAADEHGKFTLREHEDCARTAALNKSLQGEW